MPFGSFSKRFQILTGNIEPVEVFVTVKPVGQGGDYNHVFEAINGETPLAANTYLVIEVQGDWSAEGPDGIGLGIEIDDVKMGGGNYIEIRTDTANTFSGIIDDSLYRLGSRLQVVESGDVRVYGCQIYTAHNVCVESFSGGTVRIERCSLSGASQSGLQVTDAISSGYAINCIAYGLPDCGFNGWAPGVITCLFCTSVNCGSRGFANVIACNCIASNNPSQGFNGCTGNYNISDDGTAPGINSIINQNVEFLDSSINNYLLANIDLSGAIDGGLNLPEVTTDVTGAVRPNPPSIGFSEPKPLLPGQLTSTNSNTDYGLQGSIGLPTGAFTIMYRARITDWSDTPNAIQNVFSIGANDSNIYQIYSDMTAGTLRIWNNYNPERLLYDAELYTTQWLTVGMRWAGGVNSWKVFVIDDAGVIYEESYSPADSLHEFFMFGQAYPPENPQQLHGCTGIVYNGYMDDDQLLAQRQLDRPIASIVDGVTGFYPMDDWTTAWVDQSGNGNDLNPNSAGTTVTDSPY